MFSLNKWFRGSGVGLFDLFPLWCICSALDWFNIVNRFRDRSIITGEELYCGRLVQCRDRVSSWCIRSLTDGRTDSTRDGRAVWQTDRRMDGQTDGRTGGWIDVLVNVNSPDGGLTDRQTDGRTDGRPGGWADGRTSWRTDGLTDGRTDNRRNKWRDKRRGADE